VVAGGGASFVVVAVAEGAVDAEAVSASLVAAVKGGQVETAR
jgi:hypothetical protein